MRERERGGRERGGTACRVKIIRNGLTRDRTYVTGLNRLEYLDCIDAEVTIWKTRCTKRTGSTVNLTNSIYKLKKTKNNANYEQLDTGSHEVCEPDGRFRF